MTAIILPSPDTFSGDALYEVVDGNRIEMPPMSTLALLLASELYLSLGAFVKKHRLGRAVVECLFILDSDTDLRRRPDVAYVSAQRWAFTRPILTSGDWAVVPDLAIEVISTNDRYIAVLAKVGEYFHFGVAQVWVVDPIGRLAYVYDSPMRVRVVGETDVLADTIVPGFSLPLAELFAQPLEEAPPRPRDA